MANTDLQVDQWKVYPCTVVPWTAIEEWYKSGEYVPYDRVLMKDMLMDVLAKMVPWIRLNRIVRDINDVYSFDPEYRSNMRQDLEFDLKKSGRTCMCLRCREVKTQTMAADDIMMVVREYEASQGTEYFISFESKDKRVLYGFVRLRLSGHVAVDVFPELEGCAMIRELHVYGMLHKVGSLGSHVQHRGLGRQLVEKAETIAKAQGYNKMSVIAGEGTRGYYEKLGFLEDGMFMIKTI